MITALQTHSTHTQRTRYTTRRTDGTGYTVTAAPCGGYVLEGVTFATLDAALDAARHEYERTHSKNARRE